MNFFHTTKMTDLYEFKMTDFNLKLFDFWNEFSIYPSQLRFLLKVVFIKDRECIISKENDIN